MKHEEAEEIWSRSDHELRMTLFLGWRPKNQEMIRQLAALSETNEQLTLSVSIIQGDSNSPMLLLKTTLFSPLLPPRKDCEKAMEISRSPP